MKTCFLRGLAFLPFLLFLGPGLVYAPPQETPQEEVTVTAVEVPVRVLLKDAPVRDLTKDDFEVYENGNKQEITHFEIISRKISPAETPAKPEEKPEPKKRLFLLIFNIFDYDDGVGEAIDYFFREVYKPGDRVTAITEDRVLNLEHTKAVDQLVTSLKESLKKFKTISVQNTLRIFRDLRYESDKLLAALQGTEPGRMSLADLMIQYIERYMKAWDEYHRQYLMPEVAFYENLVQRIKSIEGDKWAVCFQQRDMFPQIRSASRLESEIRTWIGSQIEPQDQARARNVQARMQDLQRSFDLSTEVRPDALRDIFMRADITFHLIFLKSFRTLQDQDFELKEVSGDYEDSLRKISRATGGYLAFSNHLTEALKEATQLEDYHYLLVYSPKETSGQKKREIEVKVHKSGVDIVYLKHFAGAGPLPVTIADFKAGSKSISFALLHYQMNRTGDKTRGLADIEITLFDERSKQVFDERKTLDLFKKETHISLNFNQLNTGNYFIIIQAVDRITNKSDVFSGLIKL